MVCCSRSLLGGGGGGLKDSRSRKTLQNCPGSLDKGAGGRGAQVTGPTINFISGGYVVSRKIRFDKVTP